MWIKLAILLANSVLWWLGGMRNNKFIRKFIIPFGLGFAIGYFLPDDLLRKIVVGILSAGTLQITGLGYGGWSDDDPKKSLLANLWALVGVKDYSGEIIRASWGFLVGAVAFLPVLPYAGIGAYLAYVGINTLVSFLVSKLKLPVLITDFCVGSALASILFFI